MVQHITLEVVKERARDAQNELEQAALSWAGLSDSERERIKRECSNNGVEPMEYRVEPLPGHMYSNLCAYRVTNGVHVKGVFVDNFQTPKNYAISEAQQLCEKLNAEHDLSRKRWRFAHAAFCLETFGKRAA